MGRWQERLGDVGVGGGGNLERHRGGVKQSRVGGRRCWRSAALQCANQGKAGQGETGPGVGGRAAESGWGKGFSLGAEALARRGSGQAGINSEGDAAWSNAAGSAMTSQMGGREGETGYGWEAEWVAE